MSFLKGGVFLVLLLLGLPMISEAAEIKVSHQYSGDEYKLTLAKGERADVTVYLASFGDLVDDYPISLMNRARTRLIATKKTDIHGIARFTKVRPGSYFVVLRLSKKAWNQYPVRIGDVRLEISKAKKVTRPSYDEGDDTEDEETAASKE